MSYIGFLTDHRTAIYIGSSTTVTSPDIVDHRLEELVTAPGGAANHKPMGLDHRWSRMVAKCHRRSQNIAHTRQQWHHLTLSTTDWKSSWQRPRFCNSQAGAFRSQTVTDRCEVSQAITEHRTGCQIMPQTVWSKGKSNVMWRTWHSDVLGHQTS